MRSIERRFKHRQKKNPYWSSWVCFAEAINEQNFKKDAIREKFNKLVNITNYEKKDKMQLLKYLYWLSKKA